MRGLRSKLNDLRCALAVTAVDFDVIILVETWLNDSLSDSELGFGNYNIFRLDRNPENSVFSRGGGVLIAVRNCLCSRALSIAVANIEQLFVDVRVNGKHMILARFMFPRHLMFVYMSIIVLL